MAKRDPNEINKETHRTSNQTSRSRGDPITITAEDAECNLSLSDLSFDSSYDKDASGTSFTVSMSDFSFDGDDNELSHVLTPWEDQMKAIQRRRKLSKPSNIGSVRDRLKMFESKNKD